jgi:hypothetical protein
MPTVSRNLISFFYRGLTRQLVQNCDGELKTEVIAMAAEVSTRIFFVVQINLKTVLLS